MSKKRTYNSESRQEQAELTKKRVLEAAKQLFSANGFEKTTIDGVAALANVSAPTVYALFKSKEGLLTELMQTVLFGPHYMALVERAIGIEDPHETLRMAANISRTIYDAERAEMGFMRGASVLFPALQRLEMEGERQRYERQEFIVLRLERTNLLPNGVNAAQARDILWTLTSREIYRMFVIERGWSSDAYEEWLRQTLLQALVE